MNEYTLRYSHREYWFGLYSLFLPRSRDQQLQNGHKTPPKASDPSNCFGLGQFCTNFDTILAGNYTPRASPSRGNGFWRLLQLARAPLQASHDSDEMPLRPRATVRPPSSHFFPAPCFFPRPAVQISPLPTSKASADALFQGGYSRILNGRVRLADNLIGRFPGPANGEATPVCSSSTYSHCLSRGPVACNSCVKGSLWTSSCRRPEV